ncbi:probable mediator of RNA polymerase ii transcription subunit 26c [Phtheirospermum japonicum]|uniref:Probable mediator of RNA polymerase ii transcription subunit 26c n=1 Tax=Phtheirospermum japonicum TaxID=374723 RepID=A0A830B339_9LAMI|nr:probable mediator of RNA polymerase ii transcription subunit 26c [Phtheirospermum japonicum]
MHGRVRREGEGNSTSPERSISWHMHSAVIPADSNSFFKDGRKICVGDCALFKLSNRSTPVIGLIRLLALNEENNLQLGVNWIYRSSELKLGKGTVVDSAPNEIFYSFQKNEIPAASLLHPCKVAFLPRVGLRAEGMDQQEEVDQLLYKTRTEMHVTLQSGGRSPKQANGPTSTSQPKPTSDSGQNSGSSFPSQAKGKKRERGDHGADSVKRERSSRLDDGDLVHCKTESNLKHEIARITEKGGVVNLEAVEKLVQLMQPDRKERKMDLVCRSMLASVLASTDKVDCLNRFVQLRGLPVLDEWLQDIHKGKIGDGNIVKDGDKSVEEFLLVLLRALDKLPVNLQALQMCNIGRSVNHLRSHKNTDIQRKARSLVDTWKKRVEAEMISIDAKSGSTQAVSSWSSKSRLPEASHGGSRTPSASDVAMKSSITQNSAAKTTSGRSSPGESGMKYETSSPGPVKLASSLASGKESQPRTSAGGIADAPQTREDRSSSSNQSHNYGQSFSPKDDLKSSPSGSATVSKISSSTTRNRRISGFPGPSATGSQKETSSSKSSPVHKSAALEKLSHSALTGERVVEGPISEATSHKLVVKIPNRIRSPAQGVSGGSLEDPTSMSNLASSPVHLNKHEQSDHASKNKSDASRRDIATGMNLWQNNDPKNVLTGSEGTESHAVLRDEGQSMTTEDSKRVIEGPPTIQSKSVNLHASSFSPMNALIESCVKYSEATSSLSLDDDVGMNLLASVAAGEMSRSDMVSPTGSTERSTPAVEEVCTGDEAKSRSYPEDCPTQQNEFDNDAECDGKKQAVLNRCSIDGKCAQPQSSENIPSGEGVKDFSSSDMDSRSNADPGEISQKSNEKTGTTSKAVPISTENIRNDESNEGVCGEKAIVSKVGVSKCGSGGIDAMVTGEKDSTDHLSIDECKPTVEVAAAKPLDEGLNRITVSQQKLTATFAESEFAERADNEKLHQTEYGKNSVSEAVGAVKVEKTNDCDTKSYMSNSERLNIDKEVDRSAAVESNSAAVSCSTSHGLNRDRKEANLDKQEIPGHISCNESRCSGSADHETLEAELTGSKSSSFQADEAGKCRSAGAGAVSSSAAVASDPCTKLKFDLNEGFGADDGKYGEFVTSVSSGSTAVHVITSLPFSVNSIPSSQSPSVTVASAAIRPFVPPEDLLRNKVELGWKGSAATSAFRPAEPRKVLEMSIGTSNLSCPDASTSKHDRFPLEFDLNVPDERVLEEMTSRGSTLAVESSNALANNCVTLPYEASTSMSLRGSGGLDLDLNIVDEADETGHCSTSNNHHGEASLGHVKPLGNLHIQRDFDLNNGPAVDDATSAEVFSINQPGNGGVSSQLPSAAGLTMSNPGPNSFSSWFTPGNTFPTTSLLTDRGEQSFPVFPPGAAQRTFGPAGVTPFNQDVYRGSVLSSSPALPFPSGPFQFPVFPFGTTFPLPSATFSVGGTSYPDSSSGARLFAPPINSQYLGPVSSVASQFQRPYVVGLPDIGNNSGLTSNRKWGRQGLDLNSGPGTMESEVREESGQHSVASFQALAEEQARMFSGSGGLLKRKEPEGGLDNEPFRHKHSWQ